MSVSKPHSVRDAFTRLRGDLANLDPAMHGEDLAAATQMALDDLTYLEEQYAEATRLLALVTQLAKQQTKWEPGLGYVAIGEADAFLNEVGGADG